MEVMFLLDAQISTRQAITFCMCGDALCMIFFKFSVSESAKRTYCLSLFEADFGNNCGPMPQFHCLARGLSLASVDQYLYTIPNCRTAKLVPVCLKVYSSWFAANCNFEMCEIP